MKAKKLTLNETWRLCLKMWKWIAKQVRAGNQKSIESLKVKWLENNWAGGQVRAYCFFCEYTTTHFREGENVGCAICPAKLVDKQFDCVDTDYNFSRCPIPFYNKLVSLNRKRLKAKKKPA